MPFPPTGPGSVKFSTSVRAGPAEGVQYEVAGASRQRQYRRPPPDGLRGARLGAGGWGWWRIALIVWALGGAIRSRCCSRAAASVRSAEPTVRRGHAKPTNGRRNLFRSLWPIPNRYGTQIFPGSSWGRHISAGHACPVQGRHTVGLWRSQRPDRAVLSARATRKSTSTPISSRPSRSGSAQAGILRPPMWWPMKSVIMSRISLASWNRPRACVSSRERGAVERDFGHGRIAGRLPVSGVWARLCGGTASGTLEQGDIDEAVNAAAQIGDDTLQRNAGQRPMPDSFTHGTSEQRKRWLGDRL